MADLQRALERRLDARARTRVRSLIWPVLDHRGTFHTGIRHVRFSAGTRPREAIG
jgi:hypothetical protein